MFQPIGKLVIGKFESKSQGPNAKKEGASQQARPEVKAPGIARSLEAAVILVKINQASAGRYRATTYRSGRLTVVAPSPAAAQELSLRREAVAEEINKLFAGSGGEVVREVVVRS